MASFLLVLSTAAGPFWRLKAQLTDAGGRRGTVVQPAQQPFETGLDRGDANYLPLTPVSFLTRAAASFAGKTAVIHGRRRISYSELFDHCRRLASALQRRGIGRLDTIAILASNIPEMIEAHFAVPMLGAVLNPLNTRLDAGAIAFSLNHGNAKLLIVDREYGELVREALREVGQKLLVIDVDDPEAGGGTQVGNLDYETLLGEGEAGLNPCGPDDEWQSMCLECPPASGLTSQPKQKRQITGDLVMDDVDCSLSSPPCSHRTRGEHGPDGNILMPHHLPSGVQGLLLTPCERRFANAIRAEHGAPTCSTTIG